MEAVLHLEADSRGSLFFEADFGGYLFFRGRFNTGPRIFNGQI
jgi:hypothetical protein